MSGDLDLNLLAMFVVFCDNACSIKRTAGLLFITEPAVHAQLRRLSEQLGVPLYERAGRQLLLTEAGERLLRFARSVEAQKRQFLCPDEAFVPTVAAGRGTWLTLLSPLLRPPFVRPFVGSGDEILQAVLRGRALLGVAAGPISSKVRQAPFRRSRLCVVGEDLEQLQQRTWILPTIDRPHRRALERWFIKENLSIADRVVVDDWQLMVRFAQAGLGLAVVNELMVPEAMPRRVLSDWPQVLYRWFWLASDNTRAEALIQRLVGGAGGGTPLEG